MNRWSELKEAFWAIADSEPAERARQLGALASTDPEMHRQLEALLAADGLGEPLLDTFQAAVPPVRLGRYEIVDVLGVGGMGQVYRARDCRLLREVAIKILPASVSSNPDRLARFEREAQLLASLNHPHIAQVYGLEDCGDAPALVMELVEGSTLAQLIAGYPEAPIALARVLTIGRQIADGLDAAHEKGIIHRDLKPGNIALTPAGDVKIFDFGVAKNLHHAAMIAPPAAGETDAGAVLGTPAYMSPEQARGAAVDKRTDIWAFGCVLYELLTGRRPFTGVTASDHIAAVLERDPDMAILPASTPPALTSLIRHCLEKDPRRRLRDVADARLAIDDIATQPADDRAAQVAGVGEPLPARNPVRRRVLGILGGCGLAAAVAAAFFAGRLGGISPVDATETVVASVVLPGGMRLAGGDLHSESGLAVSPDGRRLAVVAADESGRARLWLRELASATFQPLPGTEDASYPFWSPDSESIAFIAAAKLKTIRASGGPTVAVCDAGFRTGAWGRDGFILFTPAGSSPLYRVRASGGEPTPVTTLDSANGEVQHSYPTFLPDGRHFLYSSVGSRTGGALDPRGVYVGSLDAAEPVKLLLPGATQARYASDYVLFLKGGRLMAQPFDATRAERRGAPFPMVEQIKASTAGATGVTRAFSVSEQGVLVYQTGSTTASQPTWFDRNGRQLAVLGRVADYGELALSRNGATLAVSLMDPALSTRDLWLYEVDGGRGQRLTTDGSDEFAPVWSPDGKRLLFSSLDKGSANLYVTRVNGLGDQQPVKADNLGLGRFAADWSGDDRFIMYEAGGRAIGDKSDLWVSSVGRPQHAHALLESTFVETHGRFAPDGAWFLYTSNETGRFEVYADRFPDRGAKRLVSTAGGGWARWARDGSEVYYLSPDNELMAATVHATTDRLEVAMPRRLFAVRTRPAVRLDAYPYDVSPDGLRFVVNTLVAETTSNAITLVLNWTEALTSR